MVREYLNKAAIKTSLEVRHQISINVLQTSKIENNLQI